jgi:kynurenine formamidase
VQGLSRARSDGGRQVGVSVARGQNATCAAIGILLAIAATLGQPLQAQPAHQTVTKEMVDKWMSDRSNWGRWGKEDERGTLNLITPKQVKAAAALVRDGVTVSLSHQLVEEPAADNRWPFSRKMGAVSASGGFLADTYSIFFHGYVHSHIDALCHDSWQGKLYNGFDRLTIANQTDGCIKLNITTARNGIVGRAVLMDIARLKGVPYLEPGQQIYIEDLEAWERQAKFKLQPGDILLLRTGRFARRAEKGPWDTSSLTAGLDASVIPWLRAQDVSVIGSDSISDVMPSRVEGVAQPIHQFILAGLGTPLMDNLDLEAAANEAAKLKRWVFMFAAAPLVVGGGTGSPLTPVAVF